MTAPAQQLEVIEVDIGPLAKPTLPLILADSAFLAALRETAKTIETLKITDATSAQLASELLQKLTSGGKKLDTARLALKRPFMDQCAKIDEVAKKPMARIEELKKTLSSMQTIYLQEQARLAREAEAERQRQLQALELQRQKEAKTEADRQAELTRKANEAAEDAAKKGIRVMEIEDEDLPAVEAPKPTAVEQQIAQLQSAPAVVVQKPTGIKVTVTLFPFVEDVSKLADPFVIKQPNMRAIRAAYCVGYAEGKPIPVVPGIRFEIQRSTASTGKGSFG